MNDKNNIGTLIIQHLRDIDEVLDSLREDAAAHSEAVLGSYAPPALRDSNGVPIMAPLLAAKSQALHALVLLRGQR